MTGARPVDRASAWIYRGLWSVLVDLFRVERGAPAAPGGAPADAVETFHPAPGFLRYLKFWFWLALLPIDIAILIGWIALAAASPLAGAILALPALALAVLPDVVAWVAIHLRYDTTWYVMTARSIRLRRGVWIVREVTITFENVQNVRVSSGPVQRRYGIADVVIETAGAGGGGHGGGGSALNQGLIEGVADAERIRDLIMARARASRTAGLGDERLPHVDAGFGAAHLEVLREIRELVAGARRA